MAQKRKKTDRIRIGDIKALFVILPSGPLSAHNAQVEVGPSKAAPSNSGRRLAAQAAVDESAWMGHAGFIDRLGLT